MKKETRIILNDSLRYADGGAGKTVVIYTQPPEVIEKVTSETIGLELSYAPISGVPGVIVREEKHTSDGRVEIMQEYCFPPDILYALYAHLEEVDSELKQEE